MKYRTRSQTFFDVQVLAVLFLIVLSPNARAQNITVEREQAARIEVELKQTDGRVDVLAGGKLFTSLVHGAYKKPVFYPVKNPTQLSMTRSFPIKSGVAGEQTDHPHHKSVWFAHDIDGVEFWSEKHGRVNVSNVQLMPKDNSVSWTGDWVELKNNRRVCQDHTVVKFAADAEARSLDYCVKVTACDREIEFADSKEGSFAVRVHPHLRIKAAPKSGVKEVFGAIENDQGLRGKAVWGKHAKWVMYSGKIDGKPAAIVIFDHPANLRHPTTWHARGYGLFAANPFGLHHFEGKPAGDGKYRLNKGESLTLRYQAIFFSSIPSRAEIEKRFAVFASSK